jgi:hypothetical protein
MHQRSSWTVSAERADAFTLNKKSGEKAIMFHLIECLSLYHPFEAKPFK